MKKTKEGARRIEQQTAQGIGEAKAPKKTVRGGSFSNLNNATTIKSQDTKRGATSQKQQRTPTQTQHHKAGTKHPTPKGTLLKHIRP